MAKPSKIEIDANRIEFILKSLSQQDKIQFLSDLIAVSLSGNRKNIMGCILDWEETANINCNPLRKKKLLARRASLNNFLSDKHNA